MKPGIHPEYKVARITCACGRVTETRSTMDEIHVEICSHCHPFFTGRQKLVDTAGRVERFMAKYGDAAKGGTDAGSEEPQVDEADAPDAAGTSEAAAAEAGVEPEGEAGDGPEAEAAGAADESVAADDEPETVAAES